MGKTIQITQQGRVLLARLHNPPHALMNDQMVSELAELVARAESDDGIGVVVFTGAQPNIFVAHYDVSELLRAAEESPPITEEQAARASRLTRRLSALTAARPFLQRSPLAGVLNMQRMHDLLLQMGRSGTIYIAAINGSTAGGGLELCLACDLRYIAHDGELAQPEVLLGFPPGAGGTQRLARLIGRARALELMLSGRVVTPEEAKSLGLVTDVVPHDQLMERVMAVAEVLATRYKRAVSVIKRCTLEGGSLPLEEGLLREQSGFLALLGTKAAKNAMQAYVSFVEQYGIIPAMDPEAREQLQAGTFAPFHEEEE